MRYDTLILGAGMSGLAAGIRLAQFDQKVAILERHSLWGGLNSFYKLGGRRFDVGLHALTNFVPKGTRGAPLSKVLRQLRIPYDALRLGEHRHSEIAFPGLRLKFSNDFELFRSQVEEAFPDQREGFARLVTAVQETGLAGDASSDTDARVVLREFLTDRKLIDALLLPACYYGSARPHAPDWLTFAILFRSILLEGLCRPEGGIRPVLDLLRRRYKDLGGELRMRSGVREIVTDAGRATGVVLDDGTELEADRILSSAGWPETMRLAGAPLPETEVGQISFVESISVLDTTPAEHGIDAAVAFYCLDDEFRYDVPEGAVDLRSGVLSAPNNFVAEEEPMPEGILRVTVLADPAQWAGGPEDEYRARKQRAAADAIAELAPLYPDWNQRTVFRDVFTPRTITRFTGHKNGAVYGSPTKHRDGATGVAGLSLIGTDQGYLGVVGAMMSGISMANLHGLAPAASTPAQGSTP